MIEQRGSKFVVKSEHGRTLGTHKTQAEAKSQLTAIHISQARKAGHRIPQPGAAKRKAGKKRRRPVRSIGTLAFGQRE